MELWEIESYVRGAMWGFGEQLYANAAQMHRIERKLARIEDSQQRIEEQLRGNQQTLKAILEKEGEEIMDLDTILVKCTALTTADDSLEALLAGVKQQLADAAGDPVKEQAIADNLDANLAKVNAALSAGTGATVVAPPASVIVAAASPSATPATVAAAAAADPAANTDAAAAAASAPDATPATVAVAAATP